MPLIAKPNQQFENSPASDNSDTVGSLMRCGACRQPNDSTRRFCAKCGASLWETCKCGASYALGESFCGSCGTDLAAAWNARRTSFENDWKQAVKYRQQCQYDEAISLLMSLTREEHPELRQHADKAQQLIERFSAEKQAHVERAEAALEQAKQLTKSNAYEKIIGLLADIPEPFRSTETTAILRVAESRRNERLALSGEIRSAVEKKTVLELMPKLERMLQLIPNHRQATELGGQVRDQLVKLAKKKLANYHYRQAHDLLERIAPFAQTKESRHLLAQVDELMCLMADLGTSPLIDQPLLAIADKLTKAMPTNKQVAQMRQQLLNGLQRRPKDPRHPVPSWVSAPPRTQFGFPVDWLGGSQRIAGWPALPSNDHHQHSGCFFVACGLALQAMGRAHINANLVPPGKKKGLFGEFSFGKRKKAQAQQAWGFDVGPSALKVVKLAVDQESNLITIVFCQRLEHDRRLGQAKDVKEEQEIVKRTLARCVAQNEIDDQPLAVSIRGSRVIGRFVRLPPMDSKIVHDTVRFELHNQIPLPENEIVWDYHLEDEEQIDEDEFELLLEQRHVTLLATREVNARGQLQPFHELGLKVQVLQSESVALHNFVTHEFAGEFPVDDKDPAESKGIAVLDVGSDACSLVVSMSRRVWFRSFSTGSDEFSKSLLIPFKLTLEQAEKLKANPARAPRLSHVNELYEPVFDSIVGEVERSLDLFQRENAECLIGHMYGVGGGMLMHGMLKALRVGAEEKI